MSGQDLMGEMLDNAQQLTEALADWKREGRAYARANREYRVALAAKLRELKAEGHAATLCGDLARGDERVADLGMLRDDHEILYGVEQERVNVIKLNQRLLMEFWQKEYGQ